MCALASFGVSLVLETTTVDGIQAAWAALAYAGLVSVGVAYTLQVLAQKHAHPAHAAIILSLETVFAAIGGMLFLDESLSGRALFGCGLMLVGMLISQVPLRYLVKSRHQKAA
ncbi:EamA-like transporter family protein [Shewanella khirikhana]|uniref:EamA-like transporter family protein n=1 Tax=Shewanella khirikhana TaxID=1965282 RepID=A0ABM7D1C5_9GAMM|nr:EamA-like transporter family protein [Shewanella khirikhana]